MDRKVLLKRSLFPGTENIDPGVTTKELFRMANAHAEITVRMDDHYRQYIETHIQPHPIPDGKADLKERLTHYRILKCPSVRMPLLLIWKQSSPYKEEYGKDKDAVPYIFVKELGLALWRKEQDRLNSAHPSAKLIASQRQYLIQAARLVDAAMAYGLVIAKHVGKPKPHIDGTGRLHEMMVRLEAAHLILAHEALCGLGYDDARCSEDQR